MSRLLSGHPENPELPKLDASAIGPGKWVLMNENLSAFVGLWGMTFSANFTPDEQTGIRLWTEENYINAMHNGKNMGTGRPIMPPMPWFNLTHAKDEDLKAVFAYFKSVTSIKKFGSGTNSTRSIE